MSRHGKLSKDSARICFITTTETAQELTAMAKKEKRSVSNFMAVLVEKIVADLKAKPTGKTKPINPAGEALQARASKPKLPPTGRARMPLDLG